MQNDKKSYIPPKLTVVSFVIERGLTASGNSTSSTQHGDQMLLDQQGSAQQNTEMFNWHWCGE